MPHLHITAVIPSDASNLPYSGAPLLSLPLLAPLPGNPAAARIRSAAALSPSSCCRPALGLFSPFALMTIRPLLRAASMTTPCIKERRRQGLQWIHSGWQGNGCNTNGKGAYFYFTRFAKMSTNDSRLKRTTGMGCWQLSGKHEAIKIVLLRYRSYLTYKRLDGQKNNWCMKGLRLNPKYFNPKKDMEMSLCIIINTGKAEAENDHILREVISKHSSNEGCEENEASSPIECDIKGNKQVEHEIAEYSQLTVWGAPEQITNYEAGGSQDEEIGFCRIRNTGKAEAANGDQPQEVICKPSSKKMGAGECEQEVESTVMVSTSEWYKRIEHELGDGNELSNDRAQEGSTKYDQVGQGRKTLTNIHGVRRNTLAYVFELTDEEAIQCLYAKSHELFIFAAASGLHLGLEYLPG